MTTKSLIPDRFSWIFPDTMTLRDAVDNTAGTQKITKVYISARSVEIVATGKVVSVVSSKGLREDVFIRYPSENARVLQGALRARWPSILERAQALRNEIPDPVQSLIGLMDSLPGDEGQWQEIIEEPYG